MVDCVRARLEAWKQCEPGWRLALGTLALSVLVLWIGVAIQLLLPLELLRWFELEH